ncbi:MAG TPA: hypothetical protein VJT80_05295 [Steroidobacteraceae bacterium]|nr:hypothetical protein [Steroidobacteraceae bacterium]
MTRHTFDLLLEVLDHEVTDVDDVSCGMVDDIELSNTPEGPVVSALLIGPGAWIPRLPAMLQWVAPKVLGSATVRVPWDEVERVAETIKLKSTAGALGLGRLDRRVGAWLSRKPES